MATERTPRDTPGGRPGIGATLATAAGVALLVGLGTWQLGRADWKRALLAEMAERIDAAPVELPARIEDPEAWRYRPVLVTGTFDHAHEMAVVAGRGVDLVTPVLRADGSAVLAVRGRFADPAEAPRPEGVQTVVGIARLSGRQGPFTPDNRPAEGRWFWRDLPAMAEAAGLDNAPPLFVETLDSGLTRRDIPNNHLAYALTWYALALVLAAIRVLLGVRHTDRP